MKETRMNTNAESLHRPHWTKLVLESRTLLEAGSFAMSYPWLQLTPKGDGHPVLVLPGFLASDFSTKLLRTFLKSRHYRAYGWRLGRKFGTQACNAPHCSRLLASFACRAQGFGRSQ